MMAIEGNHEIEAQGENTTFAAYSARFAFPSKESGSESTMYYSFNAGGIHFLMLGGYIAYDKSCKNQSFYANSYAFLFKSNEVVTFV